MRDGLGRVGSVLLLGGTSEIGLAVASELVTERGARDVVLAARDTPRRPAAAAQLEAAGAEVHTVDLDAADTDSHEDLIARIWKEHGDRDVTILAFGILGDQEEAEANLDHALEIAAVDYLGAVSICTPLARHLEEQGHGHLVVLSSVAAVRPRRNNYVYASAKAGLDALSQGLGDRLARSAVHVLTVRPGFVHTRMTAGRPPAPFATTKEVVAAQVLRGLDRGSSVVHAPPALRWVAPLLRVLPRPLWRRLSERA